MNDSSLSEGTSKDGGLDLKKLRPCSPACVASQAA